MRLTSIRPLRSITHCTFFRRFSSLEHLMSFNEKKRALPPTIQLTNPHEITSAREVITQQLQTRGIAVIRLTSTSAYGPDDLSNIISSLGGNGTIEGHQSAVLYQSDVASIDSTKNPSGFALHTDGANLNGMIERAGKIKIIHNTPPFAIFMHTQPAIKGGDFFVADGCEIVSRVVTEKPQLIPWLLSPLPLPMFARHEILSRFPILSLSFYSNRWSLTMAHNPRRLLECASGHECDKQNFIDLFSIINDCLQQVNSEKNLIIIIDNYRMLHGRTPILDGIRQILGAWFNIKSLISGISLPSDIHQQLLTYLADIYSDFPTDIKAHPYFGRT